MTIKSKVTRIVQPSDTMTINKFRRSSLTFDLSAKVAHIGVQSIYLNIVFSETIRLIRPKMPLTYVVNDYSDMSLSKGHLGSRGAKHLKIN